MYGNYVYGTHVYGTYVYGTYIYVYILSTYKYIFIDYLAVCITVSDISSGMTYFLYYLKEMYVFIDKI